MRGAGQPPRTTGGASFPHPSCHSRTHPVIPAAILSFLHPILSFPRRRESSGLHPSDGGRP